MAKKPTQQNTLSTHDKHLLFDQLVENGELSLINEKVTNIKKLLTKRLQNSKLETELLRTIPKTPQLHKEREEAEKQERMLRQGLYFFTNKGEVAKYLSDLLFCIEAVEGKIPEEFVLEEKDKINKFMQGISIDEGKKLIHDPLIKQFRDESFDALIQHNTEEIRLGRVKKHFNKIIKSFSMFTDSLIKPVEHYKENKYTGPSSLPLGATTLGVDSPQSISDDQLQSFSSFFTDSKNETTQQTSLSQYNKYAKSIKSNKNGLFIIDVNTILGGKNHLKKSKSLKYAETITVANGLSKKYKQIKFVENGGSKSAAGNNLMKTADVLQDKIDESKICLYVRNITGSLDLIQEAFPKILRIDFKGLTSIVNKINKLYNSCLILGNTNSYELENVLQYIESHTIEIANEITDFLEEHNNKSLISHITMYAIITLVARNSIEDTYHKKNKSEEYDLDFDFISRFISRTIDSNLCMEKRDLFRENEFKLLEGMRYTHSDQINGFNDFQRLTYIYDHYNAIYQKRNVYSIVSDTFHINENEQINEIDIRSRQAIAENIQQDFKDFSIGEDMYKAPEVIIQSAGVKSDEQLFWLKKSENEKYAGIVLLGNIDAFIASENREREIGGTLKNQKQKEEITSVETPLTYVKRDDQGGITVNTRGSTGFLFLDKDGTISFSGGDHEDTKHLLGEQAYYMLQAHILFQIMESHELIDRRKTNRNPQSPTAPGQKKSLPKDIYRIDPRIIYKRPEIKKSGITKYVPFRSEAYVRYHKKQLYTQEDFERYAQKSMYMHAGVFLIEKDNTPYKKLFTFDVNILPLSSQIADLLNDEERQYITTIDTLENSAIKHYTDFEKLQSIISKAVNKLEGKMYIPMFYRSEHDKGEGKRPPVKAYKFFGDTINKKPTELEIAHLTRLILSQDQALQELFNSFDTGINNNTRLSKYNLRKKIQGNKIYYVSGKKIQFSVTLSDFLHLLIYISPEQQAELNEQLQDTSASIVVKDNDTLELAHKMIETIVMTNTKST